MADKRIYLELDIIHFSFLQLDINFLFNQLTSIQLKGRAKVGMSWMTFEG